ncbi:hypothetical protein QBC46DRAFT_370342 [Diplogelasinospora grovesii]|uniref:TPR domain-containing protein n=1 Tax=Diplogelasinospora grovesii TaxID=303347 RepID=A0AAN6NHI3_9PEZI|nr:hypothetical protein QBC46DRAFT_370342 [Diplogelasinospora grovesii]
MSAARISTMRTAGSLRHLSILQTPRCRSAPVRIQIALIKDSRTRAGAPCLQCRFQSTSGRPNNQQSPRQAPPPPPPLSAIPRLVGRALWGSFRNLGNIFKSETWRTQFRRNPEELVLAIAVLLAAAGIIGYAVRLYFTYFYSEQFTRYPAPIAKSLRRALYYSNYAPDPKLALKYYKLALEQCDELGLDHFSDDVMGIKIQLAAWLEKIENFDNATKVLENLLSDCKRWVEVMEKSVKDGTATTSSLLRSQAPSADKSGQTTQIDEVPETLWGKRTRILGKAVGISVKLAALYSDEHLLKPDLAHERLVWAVETALKELQRRSIEGLKEGEGDWMSSEQIGGALESLGHSYETKSQFHLALPLFFQALRLSQNPCHSAVLMNNIAISFAQQPTTGLVANPVDAMLDPTLPSKTAAEKRAAYLEAAQRWATNAKQHATEPQGEQRTPECDEACAVALCNLGDIAKMLGNTDEARRMFEQAIAKSKEVGFEPGVTQAEAGLRALSKA